MDSFVFSGTGFAVGKYEVSNDEILKYIRLGYLGGFDEVRASNSENFAEY
ncbi:MAG: hypothetical protein HUK15_07650, partial [Bacteroidales bacterium]|nr:hypothetical protein [Bacteroidales bacterium]